MQDSKPCWFKFLGNSRNLQDFEWFSWNSGQNSEHFGKIHGSPVRLTEHLLQDFQCRPWGVCGYFLEEHIIQSLRYNLNTHCILFEYALHFTLAENYIQVTELFVHLFEENKKFLLCI